MVHPFLSSVLYLNDASQCGPVPLGPTLVMQQHFDAAQGRGVPEPSRRDVLVWPSPNALLVFDGALAHGVLDSASPNVRRTMLVNWWRRQPRSVDRATAAEYAAVHKLALPSLDREQAAAPACRHMLIPVCELRSASDCAEGPAKLEDVLEARGCGPALTPAVALHHPDAVLWQVEAADEDAAAATAGDAEAPTLVAALIPDELVGSESESGSDE